MEVTTAKAMVTETLVVKDGIQKCSSEVTRDMSCRIPETEYVMGLQRIIQCIAICPKGSPPAKAGIGKKEPLSSHIGISTMFISA